MIEPFTPAELRALEIARAQMSAVDWWLHPAEQWTPVRYVHQDQRCDFCGAPIPKGAPGSRVGERGTRAWYSFHRDVWECLDCRSEGVRVELVVKGRI